jgi:hypothetical protein
MICFMCIPCNKAILIQLITDSALKNVLWQMQVPVRSNEECRQIYATQEALKVPDSKLCAGRLTGGQDACLVRKQRQCQRFLP